MDCGYWHFGRSLAPLLRDANVAHRDAVFCEGGRLREEAQASERESLAAGGERGLYAPRIKLQVQEAEAGEPLAHSKAAMCRTNRFKYVRRAFETDEFYDLAEDPGETRNLIDEPAFADEVLRLKERMLRWYMETCDVVPLATDQRNFAR